MSKGAMMVRMCRYCKFESIFPLDDHEKGHESERVRVWEAIEHYPGVVDGWLVKVKVKDLIAHIEKEAKR